MKSLKEYFGIRSRIVTGASNSKPEPQSAALPRALISASCAGGAALSRRHDSHLVNHSMLLEEINLDDADTAGLTLAPYLGGVLAGRNRPDERCFEIVTGFEIVALQFLLLRWV